MAEPYRGILGPVLGQVEAIKSARSNRAMDELQSKYLQQGFEARQQESQAAGAAGQAEADVQYLANIWGAVAQSDDIETASQRLIKGNPKFLEISQRHGLGDFSDDSGMTPEQKRSVAMDNWRAFGGAPPKQASGAEGVQSTFVGKNGNQWVVLRDGSTKDTGVPVSQFAQRPVETAEGLQAFQPGTGQMGPVISSAEDITTMRAGRAGTIAGAQAEAKAEVIPAEARTDARNKMVRARAASRRLNRVSGAVEALADNMLLQGGPFQGQAISVTKEGQELDNAVAQLLPEITALTRVPGVGSQSDLEQRLANLALPSSGFHPDVNRRNIEELNAFLSDLENALGNVAAGKQPGAPSAAGIPPPAAAAPQGAEPTATNPRTGEKLVLRNGQWVPMNAPAQ